MLNPIFGAWPFTLRLTGKPLSIQAMQGRAMRFGIWQQTPIFFCIGVSGSTAKRRTPGCCH